MSHRCVLVSGSFMPREGGAERQMRSVLSTLASQGSVVAVVTQALPGRPRREVLEGTNLTIYRVGSLAAFEKAPRLGQVLFLVAAAVRLVILRPSVVVSLQFGSATAAGSVVARLFGARHIVRLTGGGTSRFRSEALARAASPVGRGVVRLATSYSRAVVTAPARHLLVDLDEAFPALSVPLKHMPNGVALPGSPIPSRCRTGVVWYARAGTERPTEAFLEIAALRPDLEFTVIGQVIDTAAPNVSSIGWCPDVYELLARSRVLLNTSENEGMPNMALQAVAVGCHVVGAANAGLRELKDDFPHHVSLFDFGDNVGAAHELALVHKAELPGYGEPMTSDLAAQRWHELLVGAVT